jgi:hypothetical protein
MIRPAPAESGQVPPATGYGQGYRPEPASVAATTLTLTPCHAGRKGKTDDRLPQTATYPITARIAQSMATPVTAAGDPCTQRTREPAATMANSGIDHGHPRGAFGRALIAAPRAVP